MLLISTLMALAAPFAAGPETPWPVHVVDCDSHPGGRSPLMVVGTLFTGGHCFREDDANRVHVTPADQIVMPTRCVGNKYSPVMAEYVLGNVRPRPSCDEEETCVFLTSPPLNNGFLFTVDAIGFDGSAWSVTATYWHDDIKHQWSPGANIQGQMVRLGWLKPGDYTCKLTLNHRFMKAGTARPGVYELTKVLLGETKFTVGKGDPWRFHPWDQAPATAVVRTEDLQPCKFEAGPPQQPLYYAAKRLEAGPQSLAANGLAKPEDRPSSATLVVTPPLDWRQHSQKSATLWETPAAARTEGVLTARITGGGEQIMGKHDWAEVTAVEWWGRPGHDKLKVRVHATVWRRAFIDGGKEERSLPVFAVPLATDGLGPVAELAKSLEVEAVWTEGVDNPRGAELEIRH